MVLRVRRSEVVGLLATAQDLALGLPQGAHLRSAVLADEMAERLGWARPERDTLWWVATLRHVGVTATAVEANTLYGDDIEGRAHALVLDAAVPNEILRDIMTRRSAASSALGRAAAMVDLVRFARPTVHACARAEAEVAERLADRLGMGVLVRSALQGGSERWNGRGLPSGLRATTIAAPMRLAQVAFDLEVLSHRFGASRAVSTVMERSGRTYDPALATAAGRDAAEILAKFDPADFWTDALARRPDDDIVLANRSAIDAFEVIADFVDLKSAFTPGHARRIAALCSPVASDPTSALDAEAAALLHDLGQVAVPNSVLDKASPLSRFEREQVNVHARLSAQLVGRVPSLSALATTVGAHHERADGSGYHRGRRGDPGPSAAALAAAECYVAMTEDRAYRQALTPSAASIELRAMSSAGQLSPVAVEGILATAGHRSRQPRPDPPAGLTGREVDVLTLLVQGMTSKAIGQRLGLSTSTADHHVQRIYAKTGVSTRGAVALFAAEHELGDGRG